MENGDDCKKVIDALDKAKLPGTAEGITVKFADSGSSKRKQSECAISVRSLAKLLSFLFRSLERLPRGE